MQSTWLSLAWKEWHEHKWKLAAVLGVLVGVTSLVLVMERARDRFGLAIGMVFLCGIPMGAFLGLGTAANERSRGTMPFLQALPVPMWRVAVVKFVLGFATMAAAVALVVASFSLWMWAFDLLGISYTAPWRNVEQSGRIFLTGYWQIDVVTYCMIAIGSVYIWAAAVGVNRKDEISAGVVALAAIVGVWALLIFMAYANESSGVADDWLQAVGFSAAPGGYAIMIDNVRNFFFVSIGTVIAIASHVALTTRYIRRFGQVAENDARSPQVAMPRPHEWLGPPRSSVAAAIAWKQLRESGVILLAGLIGIVGICTLMYAVSSKQDVELGRIYQTYAAVAVSLGFAIALVAGIGVALHDSEPRLNLFWRSRPINSDAWFGIKFVTGLAIVLATIYIPLRLIGGSMDADSTFAMPAMHLAVFAAAVATTCIVRHAIYAAILSVGVLTVCITMAWLVRALARWFGWAELDMSIYSPFEKPEVVLAGAVVCFVVSTVAGWLAMRNDWGIKGRY